MADRTYRSGAPSLPGSYAENAVPGASDRLVLDALSADYAETRDIGTITDNGAGDYTISPGLLGILIASDYAGTFSDGGHPIALGASGLDASAASLATVQRSAATWATLGEFRADDQMTWYESTGKTVLGGGTSGARNALHAKYRGGGAGGGAVQFAELIFAAGSHWENPVASSVMTRGGLVAHGDLVSAGNITVATGDTYLGDSAVVSGTGALTTFYGDVYVGDPTSCSMTMRPYIGNQTMSGGNGLPLAALLDIWNITLAPGATLDVDQSLSLGDVQLRYYIVDDAGEIAFHGNAVHGDISETGSTGTHALTGSFSLAGTADQSIDYGQADATGLTVASAKTAGDVAFTAGSAAAITGWTLAGGVTTFGDDATFDASAADCVVDTTGGGTLVFGGDVSTVQSGGNVRWRSGAAAEVRFEGLSPQSIDLPLSAQGERVVDATANANTSADVTIVSDVWVAAFSEEAGANTLNADKIRVVMPGGAVDAASSFTAGAAAGEAFAAGAAAEDSYTAGAMKGTASV